MSEQGRVIIGKEIKQVGLNSSFFSNVAMICLDLSLKQHISYFMYKLFFSNSYKWGVFFLV